MREIDDVLVEIEDMITKLQDCKTTIANGDEPDETQTEFLKSVGIEIK